MAEGGTDRFRIEAEICGESTAYILRETIENLPEATLTAYDRESGAGTDR